MKRIVLLFGFAVMACTLWGSNDKYMQKMGETISQFSSSTTLEDYQNLANKFKVIANVEKEEWLPLYYEVQCYILISFMETSGAAKKDAYLDQAQISMERMLELAPGESEAYTLKAFYHTGRMVVNPAVRAQNTAPIIGAAIGKALAIEPGNPRALFMKISNEIGTARFFGSDTTPYCSKAVELLEKWDTYTLKSAIHPAWGKGQVVEIVNNCSE